MNLETLGRNQGNAEEHSFDSNFTPLINACRFKSGVKKQWYFCVWILFNGYLSNKLHLKLVSASSAFESIILNMHREASKEGQALLHKVYLGHFVRFLLK